MWRDCVEGRVVDDEWQNADDAVTSEIGVQQSVRYEGALPWRQIITHYRVKNLLNVYRAANFDARMHMIYRLL